MEAEEKTVTADPGLSTDTALTIDSNASGTITEGKVGATSIERSRILIREAEAEKKREQEEGAPQQP